MYASSSNDFIQIMALIIFDLSACCGFCFIKDSGLFPLLEWSSEDLSLNGEMEKK